MIYLDYAATTPVDDRVLKVMLPFFSKTFGNPSSMHFLGQQAEAAIESARETVASSLHCLPGEVIFTSCGSESDNLALRGTALYAKREYGATTILTTKAEHHAISRTAEQLFDENGFDIEWLPVDEYGMVIPECVENALKKNKKAAIVSIMFANNEIGTVNPIQEISRICRSHQVTFHTDAVQAAAYLPIDVNDLGVDLLSIGGHKFYGPKGVGALVVRNKTRMISHLTGGGQEFGLRAGTHNVPLIVGLAEALRLTKLELEQRRKQIQPLRDRLIQDVLSTIPDSHLTGHPKIRLPNHASFTFKGANGNTLVQLLDAAGFACSSGSACKTGNPEPSEVMAAIGLDREWGLGSLRITLGAGSSMVHVDSLLRSLPGLVERARIS